jgi:hypothetical protein
MVEQYSATVMGHFLNPRSEAEGKNLVLGKRVTTTVAVQAAV